jgi:hypothetical protein
MSLFVHTYQPLTSLPNAIEFLLSADPSTGPVYALLDSDQAPLLSAHQWRLVPGEGVFQGKKVIANSSGVCLHSFVSPDRVVVRYKNGNTLDVRSSNLRLVRKKGTSKAPKSTTAKWGGIPGISDSLKGSFFEVWYRVEGGKRRKKRFRYCERTKPEVFEKACSFRIQLEALIPGAY